MKFASIIILLAVTTGFASESVEIVVPKLGEQTSDTAKHPQRSPNEKISGTEQSPIFIKVIPGAEPQGDRRRAC